MFSERNDVYPSRLLWAAITVFRTESRPQLPERAAAVLLAEITRKY
jgi:hypothetical protein